MKILVTGATGMVGRNIIDFAKNIPSIKILAPSSKTLNLLSCEQTAAYIKEYQPDLIIHAAGLVGGIQANMENPVDFLVKNTDIGRNIILAAREQKVKYFLNLSSSCMYPRNAQNPLKETLILKGELEPTNEGYAIAKVFSTRLCEYISRENSYFEYKTIIPCNLYGKYDKFSPKNSHMIPAVIKKIIEAKEQKKSSVTIWGDGTVRREFMYAEDLADFIFYAIENFSNLPQNINVGLGFDYTINEYYNTIAKIVGYKGEFEYDLTKPVGMKQKLVDVSLLREFGWQHKTSLEEGILKTYEFYLKNYN
ncbi:nodulation protein NolK [Tenacibaculum holothuriorum]|uniref:GDP-L-fucose synthase n=1 Tax=Tenacibaculum holothuriorum TaxID=1635173 RepID=A0A1Y2PB58_9FLAO|nr:GDP-L-fucose synthase [Tenacibaculum holothuriorum]OSY87027.1 nodulation protein NolK [Tenacibaculum holothuriorum]